MSDPSAAVEARRERSRAWWDQRRARGICAVCRHPLDRDRTWPVHPVCRTWLKWGLTYAEVRALMGKPERT